MKRTLFSISALLFTFFIWAQGTTGIHTETIKLFKTGDQTSMPVIALHSSDQLELHFDDIESRIRNYYYTYELCNADWSPSMLHSFEYIKGFDNVRIANYRNSSISLVKYVHYQAMIPDRSCYPDKSGNYLLKVFLNNDTSQLVFERRFVVVDQQASIAANVQQPMNATLYNNAQKLHIELQISNNTKPVSPTDIRVAVLQNNSWLQSIVLDRPTIARGNYYEYSDELLTSFPAVKEYRWLDLRSLRLLSDRLTRFGNSKDSIDAFMKPDQSRVGQPYIFYKDLNGSFTMESLDPVNPFWQSDYANVHFTYFPAGNMPVKGKDLYLVGEFTNYGEDEKGKMTFNPEKGGYETTLLLKQGYYNYLIGVKEENSKRFDYSASEGNYWGTENNYKIFVYYRAFGERYDECIGYTSLSSIFQRSGL